MERQLRSWDIMDSKAKSQALDLWTLALDSMHQSITIALLENHVLFIFAPTGYPSQNPLISSSPNSS
jgi:hypothetical protein